MKRILIKALCIISALMLLSGCGKKKQHDADETGTAVPEAEVSVSETEPAEVWVPSDTDIEIAEWLEENLTDSDTFTDCVQYQYYARALGLDKDYFLTPDMWEVFYSKDIVNRNSDIDGTYIYLIRLNPDKLLEVYAENNGWTVEKLCSELSVTSAQLYYNWGYNPASVDYFSNHKQQKATYSEKEQKIFGVYNGEKRECVMKTHMLVIDRSKKDIIYSSDLSEYMEVFRKDLLGAGNPKKLYFEFTNEEKNAAFKINGIGIRAVIPLSVPNAFTEAAETELGDENVTVMINVSPYAYGCTDEDKVDTAKIYEYMASRKK